MLPKGSCLDQQRALALKRMNLPLDYCSELLLARDYCYRNVNQMSRDTYGSPPTGRDGPNGYTPASCKCGSNPGFQDGSCSIPIAMQMVGSFV